MLFSWWFTLCRYDYVCSSWMYNINYAYTRKFIDSHLDLMSSISISYGVSAYSVGVWWKLIFFSLTPRRSSSTTCIQNLACLGRKQKITFKKIVISFSWFIFWLTWGFLSVKLNNNEKKNVFQSIQKICWKKCKN